MFSTKTKTSIMLFKAYNICSLHKLMARPGRESVSDSFLIKALTLAFWFKCLDIFSKQTITIKGDAA